MERRDAGKRAEKLERAGKVGGGTAEDTGAARQAATAPGEQAGEGASGLMEEVLRRENLMAAYRRVVRNKGAGGVDGRSVDDLKHQIRTDWPRIREALLSGTYKPSPVRKVEIPKPGGGVRMLGIPTVMDRMIQQALLQGLTPIFDPTFSEDSYGFGHRREAVGLDGARIKRYCVPASIWRGEGGGWWTWTWRSSSTRCSTTS